MEKKKKNDEDLQMEKAIYQKQQDDLKIKRQRERAMDNQNFLKM